MRLKRLVARGFKSFADRTEFEFDSRLTGIIGPNGCGKSNVVDAIKWVLGDQRAKSLRGSEMTDVIFKGAEGRDAMGLAEVTITFEDEEQRSGRPEIDIARRLSLDKESTYLLNGDEVRLRDVRDTLLDTGLGTGSYSVMEQGRIDAVLSANPEARRAIFEEAAGVARFKLQKKEALRKIERTDQNLARATDLLEERARRIRSLRIQAGKARRFQEIHGRLRDLRAALAVVDGRELRAVLAEQQRKLEGLQQALATTDAARAEALELVRAGDEQITACAAALEQIQEELRRVEGELTTQRERASAQQHRAGELAAEAERSRGRAADLHVQREDRAVELASARDGLAAKEGELIELHRQLAERRRAVQQAQQSLRALQAEREALRNRLLELLHARTRARNAGADVEARLLSARAREARLCERQQVLADEAGRLAADDAGHAADLAESRTRERLLVEREQRAIADLAEADAAAAELAARESQLGFELSQLDGRRQALIGMEAHMEGLDAAPRHVLQTRPEGLRGRLLDLLEVDLDYGAALEAALGPFVQALVVDTRAHAEAIVRDLQAARLGRVLLLVEAEFGPELEQPSLLPLPPGARFLLDLVRHAPAAAPEPGAPDGSRRLLAWLLRGVVFVEAMDRADATRVDLCFVTPDGTLLCGPRIEGGAAAEGHSGLVVRRSQILRLSEQVAAVQARVQELAVGKEAAVGRVERLKSECRALQEALQVVRRRTHEIQAQQARIQARLGDIQKEQAELELEAGELARGVALALATLGRLLFDQHLIARRETAAQGVEQEFGERIAAATGLAEAEARAEQELRLQQAQAGEAREGLVRTIRMREEALRELEQAAQELADRAQTAADGATRAAAEQARYEAAATALADELAAGERQKTERQAELERAQKERQQRQHALHSIEVRRNQTSEELTEMRLAVADTQHRFARLEDRLREETEIELRRCLGEIHGLGLETGDAEGPVARDGSASEGSVSEGWVETLQGPPLPPSVVRAWYGLLRLWERPDFDVSEARKEVQVLQAQKDRLGAINLDAVRELDEEEGQFTTLEQEVHDLKEARKALMETLRKLEVESKLLFEQTFAEARKNFQEIFRKLFQGGKADMFLSNTEEMLEAGIEIVAQPPGKQLQSINLLSGGERSLTAVAILFALFKVRPSPFCILDEVDAALDETNVERFLRVLRDFTGNTQFCIVTHHKRTMAECQVLYGITMQRRGISSRIAVALHEVESFVETAAAGVKTDLAQKQRIAGEEVIGF